MKVKFYHYGFLTDGTLINCETGSRYDDVNYFVLLSPESVYFNPKRPIIRVNQSVVISVTK